MRRADGSVVVGARNLSTSRHDGQETFTVDAVK